MKPSKYNTVERRNTRSSTRTGNFNVSMPNVTGVLGDNPEGNVGVEEIGPNDIVMKTEVPDIKMETRSCENFPIDTSGACCKMDFDVGNDDNGLIDMVDNSGVEEVSNVPLDEINSIIESRPGQHAIQLSSSSEHWCVWRQKFTEVKKKLEEVESALTIFKSVLEDKHQDNSISQEVSRYKRHAKNNQPPVVRDDLVPQDRYTQHVDDFHAGLEKTTSLAINENPDLERLVGNTTTASQIKGKKGRATHFKLADNTPAWLNIYYSSAEFPILFQNDKISALLPGVLQVLKDNWTDFKANRRAKFDHYINYNLKKGDLLNCRLVCPTWEKSVDTYLSNDIFFEEYNWMDVTNIWTESAMDQWTRNYFSEYTDGLPFTLNWKKWILTKQLKKIVPFTLDLTDSNEALEFLQDFDSSKHKENPLFNRFLMLSFDPCNTNHRRGGVEYWYLWYKILDRVGQYIWHLKIQNYDMSDPEFDCWKCVVECLKRTTNLKTLTIFGVKRLHTRKKKITVNFPHLPHLRVIQCHKVEKNVIKSLLQSNTQVERLHLRMRIRNKRFHISRFHRSKNVSDDDDESENNTTDDDESENDTTDDDESENDTTDNESAIETEEKRKDNNKCVKEDEAEKTDKDKSKNENENISIETESGGLETLELTKLTNVALQLVLDSNNDTINNGQILKEIDHLRWMKKWPITKLELTCSNQFEYGLKHIIDRLKVFSATLTHLSIGNVLICDPRHRSKSEVIPLKESLPNLEQLVLHLRVKPHIVKFIEQTGGFRKQTVRKSTGASRPMYTQKSVYPHLMKFEIPKNMKVLLIEVAVDHYLELNT